MGKIVLLEDVREQRKIIDLEDLRVDNALLYNQMLRSFLEVRETVKQEFILESMIDMTEALAEDVVAWLNSLQDWQEEIYKQKK